MLTHHFAALLLAASLINPPLGCFDCHEDAKRYATVAHAARRCDPTAERPCMTYGWGATADDICGAIGINPEAQRTLDSIISDYEHDGCVDVYPPCPGSLAVYECQGDPKSATCQLLPQD
jgi:hypothetical protein